MLVSRDTFTDTPQNDGLPEYPASLSLVRLTHKINHHIYQVNSLNGRTKINKFCCYCPSHSNGTYWGVLIGTAYL